jgi:hypothetical protein
MFVKFTKKIEISDLPVNKAFTKNAIGFKFAYKLDSDGNKEYRNPEKGEWFESPTFNNIQIKELSDFNLGERYILEPISSENIYYEPNKPSELSKPSKSNKTHYSGEPCSFPVCNFHKNKAIGFKFEYTGEYRSLKSGEWFVTENGKEIMVSDYNYVDCCRWILKPILIKESELSKKIYLFEEDAEFIFATKIFNGYLYELLNACPFNSKIENVEITFRAKIKPN